MKDVLGKGLLGQLGVGGILVVLILQIVLPYVAGSAPDQAATTHKLTIDRESVQRAVEPLLDDIETAVSLLAAQNIKQCHADERSAAADSKLIEVMTTLSQQLAITAAAVSTMQRQLERMHP